MKIQNTELEYNEDDGICLDFYLGEHNETKEQWAQRVWTKCKEWKDTDGKGYPESGYGDMGMESVYSRDPFEIWEEKKRKRRDKFIQAHFGNKCDPELLKTENIKKDLKNNLNVVWPETHSSAKVLEVKNDPKYNYKTASQVYREKLEEQEKRDAENLQFILTNIEKLREKGYDDEVIEIIYPQARGKL